MLKGMSRNQTKRKKPKGHQEKPFWFVPSLAGRDGRSAQGHWGPLGSLAGARRRVNTLHSVSGSRLEELHTHARTNRSCFPPVAASQHPAELPRPPGPSAHAAAPPGPRLLPAFLQGPANDSPLRLASN